MILKDDMSRWLYEKIRDDVDKATRIRLYEYKHKTFIELSWLSAFVSRSEDYPDIRVTYAFVDRYGAIRRRFEGYIAQNAHDEHTRLVWAQGIASWNGLKQKIEQAMKRAEKSYAERNK